MNYYLVGLMEYYDEHSLVERNKLIVSEKPLSYEEIQVRCNTNNWRNIKCIELLKEVKDETEN